MRPAVPSLATERETAGRIVFCRARFVGRVLSESAPGCRCEAEIAVRFLNFAKRASLGRGKVLDGTDRQFPGRFSAKGRNLFPTKRWGRGGRGTEALRCRWWKNLRLLGRRDADGGRIRDYWTAATQMVEESEIIGTPRCRWWKNPGLLGRRDADGGRI